VKTKAEIRVPCQGMPANPWKLEKPRKDSPIGFRGSVALPYLDFRLPASRIVNQ